MVDQLRNGFDFETITVSSVAVGFTSSKLAPENSKAPSRALVSFETATMRFRYDGGDPTSTVGHPTSSSGDSFILEGEESLRNFKAIRSGESDGTIQVTYER